jgi:hypothetical protein
VTASSVQVWREPEKLFQTAAMYGREEFWSVW